MKSNELLEINETEFDAHVSCCKKPVIVGFVADWSQACGRFEPVLEEVAKACEGKVKVFKVNVDDNPVLGTLYNIQSVPMLIYFLNGAVHMKIVGTVSAKAVLTKLQSLSQQKNLLQDLNPPAPEHEI